MTSINTPWKLGETKKEYHQIQGPDTSIRYFTTTDKLLSSNFICVNYHHNVSRSVLAV